MLSLPRFTSAWIAAIGSWALCPAVSVAAQPPASPAEVVPAERQQVEAGAVPEGLGKSDWASIREAYEAGQHAFRPGDEGWVAHNPGQQWTTRFDGRGFVVEPRHGEWKWGLDFVAYGFEGHRTAAKGIPEVGAEGQRLSYQWDDNVEEWFINDGRGLEHGFIVRQRPAGGGAAADENRPLTFTLATRGDCAPAFPPTGRRCISGMRHKYPC
jgi:hypothetical protein